MMTGLNIDLRDIDGPRKTAVISSELARLNVDIAALQETRLADYGSFREKEYTFFWQGKSVEDRREQGVGFAIRNRLLPMVEPGDYKSERVMHIKLNTVTGTIHLVSAYAPTLTSSSDIKDAFYSELEDFIKRVPKNHPLIILGDFNARVGDDQGSWPICLGHAGVGKCNENGQRLLELCTHYQLCITNTFFAVKKRHRVSWMHPRSKHWHQLDLIIIRREHLHTIRSTSTFHSADCDSDHSLVITKVTFRAKTIMSGTTPRSVSMQLPPPSQREPRNLKICLTAN